MRIAYTDGADPDFLACCARLDEILNELAGGEANRAQYVPLNTVEKIRDAFVAYEGEQPVGCAAFRWYEQGVAEVKRVFVAPEYRKRGVGRLLMQTLEEEARRQGYTVLILETGMPLVAAHAMYLGMGYAVTENYGVYACADLYGDSLCMRKELR